MSEETEVVESEVTEAEPGPDDRAAANLDELWSDDGSDETEAEVDSGDGGNSEGDKPDGETGDGDGGDDKRVDSEESDSDGDKSEADSADDKSASDYWAEIAKLEGEGLRIKHEARKFQEQAQHWYQQGQQLVDAIKKDPISVLRHFGHDDDAIINAVLGGDTSQAKPKRRDEYTQKLEQRIAQLEQAAQNSGQANLERQVHDKLTSVIGAKDADGNLRYEMCADDPDTAIAHVIDIANRAYEQYGQTPAAEEIVAHVEQYLVGQEKQRLERRKGSRLFGQLFGSQPPPPVEVGGKPAEVGGKPAKSLPANPNPRSAGQKPQTEEERDAAALRALDSLWKD